MSEVLIQNLSLAEEYFYIYIYVINICDWIREGVKNLSHGNRASTDNIFPSFLNGKRYLRITRSEMGGNGRGENYF